jgi:small multidrug resistance pump
MGYFYLAIAIISEVAGTSALKASAQFTRLVPSLIVVVGYGLSFYMLTLVLKTLPLGITYALWSGLGMILVALVGVYFYKQSLDFPALLGIALIILGVVVMQLFSKSLTP